MPFHAGLQPKGTDQGKTANDTFTSNDDCNSKFYIMLRAGQGALCNPKAEVE